MDQKSTPIKTILVRAPNWIGDQILAYPFFFHLRNAYPSAKIISVCVPWVKSIQYKGLVDEVVVLPVEKGAYRKLHALKETARSIRRIHGSIDIAFSLPNSFSSALLLFLTRASQRVGYSGDLRSFLLTHRPLQDNEKHRSVTYLDLLAARHSVEGELVFPKTEAEFRSLGWNIQAGLTLTNTLPESYFVFAPGSQAESRRWPEDRFLELSDLLWSSLRIKTVLVGGPKEAPLAERMSRGRQEWVVDAVAKTEVAGLVPVLMGAKGVIANDSGLAHLASFCGARVVIPWGAGDPRHTLPLGPGRVEHRVHVVECWPCEKNLCRFTDSRRNQCLNGLTVEAMWELVSADEEEGDLWLSSKN